MGFEAISRAAAELVLVDGDSRVVRTLRAAAGALGVEDASRIVRAQLPGDFGRVPPGPFDLIYLDPPYAFDGYREVLEEAADWLAPSGRIAAEHDLRVDLPQAIGVLRRLDSRRYGDTVLSFYGASRA